MADKVPCPYCGKPADPASVPGEGDIICVQCGTNLLTGQKIAEEQPEQPRPKASAGFRPSPWAILGVVAVVIVVAAVGLVSLYLSRDPVAEAERLIQAGNPLEAIGVLQEHVERRPDNGRAHLLLGKLHWQSQDYRAAAKEFDAAANLGTGNGKADLYAAVAASRLPGTQGRQQQIAALNRLVEKDPGNTRAWYLLALARGANGNYAGQAEALGKMLDQGGDRAAAQRFLGVAYALQGNYGQASEALEAAATLEPGNATAAVARGVLATMRGEFDAALQAFEETIEEGTGAAGLAKARLGLIHMQQGQFERAQTLLDAAQSANPNHAAINFFHALCLQANGLQSEALVAFERIANGDSPYAEEAAVQMALIFLRQDDAQRAQDAVRKASNQGITSARLHTIEGLALLALGEEAQAQQSFRRAVQVDPDYAPAHLENGLMYISRGVLAQGVRELDRFLELAKEDGQDVPGINEIQLLVDQLRRAAEQERAGTAQPAAAAEPEGEEKPA